MTDSDELPWASIPGTGAEDQQPWPQAPPPAPPPPPPWQRGPTPGAHPGPGPGEPGAGGDWPGAGWSGAGGQASPRSTPAPGPAPVPGRAARTTGPRMAMALAAVAAVVGGLIGAGAQGLVNLHGSRPALSADPVAPGGSQGSTSPAAPGTSGSPFRQFPGRAYGSPGSGGGSAPGAVGPGATAAQAASVASKIDPAIVDVNTILGYGQGEGAGTGMILTPNGEILTNNHVIDGATSITVTLVATGRTYEATVVGTAPTEDVAVIQLKGASGLTPITVAGSSNVALGSPVVAIGNAMGAGGTPSVVTGSVLAVDQTITARDEAGGNAQTLDGLIQTNAPIQPGDSGGPLANVAGEVIGMNTAAEAGGRRFSSVTTAGFAIPIAHARSVASQIESGKASATIHIGLPGFLGVSVANASGQGASGQGASGQGAAGQGGGGALVTNVRPSSPAASAGLSAGDLITSVDGKGVDSPDTVSSVTKSHRPGDRVSVAWTGRDGRSHKATVTLAAGPAD